MEIPPKVKENYLSKLVEDIKKQQNNSGSIDEEKLKQYYNDSADWNLKWYFIRHEIIEGENISVTNSETQTEIDEIVEKNKDLSTKVRSFYNDDKNRKNLEDKIINKKLYEILKASAKINVITKSTDEIKKENHNHG